MHVRILNLLVCLLVLLVTACTSVVHAEEFFPANVLELQEAIEQAGSNEQHDIIDLDDGVFALAKELVLGADEGFGVVIRNGTLERSDSAAFFRLLRLEPVPYFAQNNQAPVQLEQLVFRNGYFRQSDANPGEWGGGALLSHRVTRISDAEFVGNRAVGNTSGGAIQHTSTLEVSRTLFANNSVLVSDNVQTSHGGAVASSTGASLYVAHSYFLGNSADHGGAIHAAHGVNQVNITRSSFDGNEATATGGALWANTGNGELRISNSSFVANQAPLGGGGVFAQSLYAKVLFKHVTFWGNGSEAGQGGAIKALIPRQGSTVSLQNSVIANNVGGNCVDTEGQPLSFSESAHNLVDDTSCGQDGITLPDTAVSVFAGQLDYYGGVIPSLPILASSPASNLVPRDACLAFDARDVPRLDNDTIEDYYCDAGAFEYVPLSLVDEDGDDVRNRRDNCVSESNPLQSDIDNDGIGDSCDSRDDRDTDQDAILNFSDNCPTVSNFFQLDTNGDGIGDACDKPALPLARM